MHFRSKVMAGLLMALVSALPAAATPNCVPSGAVKSYDYPGAERIPTTNNLILPTGKSIPAEGQRLMISGRVLDRHCAPVQEAVVELWQVSPFGRWLLAEGDELATPLPTFAGAGRTYTDGDGAFLFVTAFPAPSRYGAPNVNIKIKPERMANYTSALYFSDDRRNDADKAYGRLAGKVRGDTTIRMSQTPEGELVGSIDIVLPGLSPYRTY